MITSTTTTTIEAHDDPIMSFMGTSNNSSMESNCKKIMNDLVEITNKYKDWDDLVSRKINKWSKKSLKRIYNTIRENSSNILDVIQSDVNKLFTKVLISTYFKPLQNPILVGSFTLEPEELAWYCGTCEYRTEPGFYKEEDLNLKKEHTFAIEMLKWGRNLPIKQTEESLELSSIGNNYSIEKVSSQLAIYLKCEKIAGKQLNMYEDHQSFKEGLEDIQNLTAKVNEHFQVAVDAAKLHEQEEKNKTIKAMEEIRKNHDKTFEVLNEQIQRKDNIIRERNGELTGIQQANETSENRADALEGNVKSNDIKANKLEKKAEKPHCTIF